MANPANNLLQSRLNINESLKCKQECSILHAEIYVIKEASKLLLTTNKSLDDITIYTDSKSVL